MHDTVFSKEIVRALEEKERSLKPGEVIKKAIVDLSPLSHVKSDTLKETFALMVKGTRFAEVALEIKTLGLKVICGSCGKEFSVMKPTFACTDCAGPIDIKENKEFAVKSIETAIGRL